MEIAVIGDVHDHQERLSLVLARLASARRDLCVLVGDVGQDPPFDRVGRRTRRAAHDESLRRVIGRVHDALACPVAFVPGNHDLPNAVDDTKGVNCDRRVQEVSGLKLAGLGGAGPTRFGFPYEWDEDEADSTLREVLAPGGHVDLLISHTPPAGTTLDRTSRGEHVGSDAVGRWIGAARPGLVVCGHIHEGWGVEQVHGVPCLNAGALGEPYGQPIAWSVSWADGRPTAIRSFRETANGETEIRDW